MQGFFNFFYQNPAFFTKKSINWQVYTHIYAILVVVRLTGLEPARRKTPDPKSDASTNSATGAFCSVLSLSDTRSDCKGTNNISFHQKFSCKFYHCISSLTEIIVCQLNFVVWSDAELYLLAVAVVGRTC